ncbi:MAG: hypothetical protein QGH20_07285 [Candidatus Latescibacteria bacterium]|jgi:hypothetical protein|nr:hypothetical protein [Candidatus Latescibacterota bacterium]
MRREQIGKVVEIGQGLCRVSVRSQQTRDRLAAVPGIRVEIEDAEYIGWRVIFPSEMRPMVERLFKKHPPIDTAPPTQLGLFGAAGAEETGGQDQ